jgi:HSP20 family protein
MAGDRVRVTRLLFLPGAERYREVVWRPAVDVYRTNKGWLVKYELAGVRPEDIRLSASGQHLTVEGLRRDCFAEEDCCCYRMEISYSHFERTIELPADLEQTHIATRFENGMLLVRIETEANP